MLRAAALAAALLSTCALTAADAGAVADRDAAARPAPAVRAYPSSQSIPPSGGIPGGSAAIALNAATGEKEGAWIVVSGAGSVAASVQNTALGPLGVEVDFGHFVQFGRRAVPDALLPWNGSARATEKPNQPLYVRVNVPEGTAPGTYRGRITVSAEGQTVAVPLSVRVHGVAVPAAGNPAGNMLTSFHVVPQTYLNKVDALYRLGSNTERSQVNRALFPWLAAYRISPSSWGYGEPRGPSGYGGDARWWLDSAGNMAGQMANAKFSAMRVPISSNRQRRPIAGVSPARPETWCDYLRNVHSFWGTHGWLNGTIPYVYALDEPGLSGQRLVARQARATHACFPGGQQLMTGNPSPANRFLWNGGSDDLDIWVVLLRRWYGRFTSPGHAANRARENLRHIAAVRGRPGRMVWSYTYSAIPGTPGLRADGALSEPRMYLLWNALEGTDGVLYGQGTTNYTTPNPLDRVDRGGEFVLFYPGRQTPIPSARLEQIRDGLEDAAIFNAVRRKRGAGAVRAVLGGTGLFSADARGVVLACNVGCALRGPNAYAWPRWSHDASTPRRIEQAKARVLSLAASTGRSGSRTRSARAGA